MLKLETIRFNDYRDINQRWVDSLELRELPEYRPQRRNVNHASYSINDKKICGADTETLKGKVWLFSTEFGVWEVDDIGKLIEVCFNKYHSYKYTRTRKKGKVEKSMTTKEYFFYNLKFDAQALMKTMDDKDIEVLLDEGKIRIFVNSFGREMEIEITYLEGKHMQIKPIDFYVDLHKLSAIKMWDISQFYNKMRLQKAGEVFLGKGKMELCFDGTKLDVSKLDDDIIVEDMDTGQTKFVKYHEYYFEDIKKYAILDAQLCGELTRLKKKQFVESGVRFANPYSVANVAQKFLLENYEIPTINEYIFANGIYSDVAKWIVRFSYQSYTGGWFEVCGNGMVDEHISAWDLASAYPYVMYHLDDISKGKWIIGNEDDDFEEILENVYPMQIGFVEAFIRFPKGNNWNPLTRKSKLGTLISPRTIQGVFTLDEIREALKWNPELIQYGEFCVFYPDTKIKPFRPFIEKFYEIKMTAPKDSAERATSKLLLNATYGKTIQAVENKSGKMFNPMYASVITAYTRVRLAEMIRVNDQKVLSLATDGIVLNNPNPVIPPLELPACYNLGEWENEAKEGADLAFICIQSGVYSLIDKKTKEAYKHTFRGSASYFLRGYENCYDFLLKNEDKNKIEKSIHKPYSVKESRIKSDFALINIFALRKYSISVIGDSTKRLRDIQPNKFGDLLNYWFPTNPHSSNVMHDVISEMLESQPKEEVIIVKADDVDYEIDDDDLTLI